MQHLENDMDDLFQRAAENYPLQKGKDDWESIAKKISDNPGSPKVIPVQNKRNKKFIAFALLLLMLAVSWFIFQNTKTGRYADMKKTELKGTKSIPNNSEINNKKTGIAGKKQAFNINEKNKSDNQNNNKSITHSSANTSTNFTAATVKVSFYSKNNNANQNEEIAANNVVTEKNNASNNYFSIPHIIKESPGKVIAEKQETISEDIPESRNNVNEHVSPPFLNNHSKENSNAVISEKKKQEKPRIQQKKQRIYIGIFAGPDFSKVQSGSFSHTGFDAGILLGVRVNRKISFETGFMWNKKNYNSDGKDFSMDKVGSTMPSGMVINNLKSQSSFIEIPIKIKYDFFVKS
ncbi:MAG: hypothetical protein ABI419_10055, partial [Ginsengibacter sp.]